MSLDWVIEEKPVTQAMLKASNVKGRTILDALI
jgi:hypothetical protein